ncbi:MAG: DUF1592 domain-containing protein, partial [Planctomycetota bacterium]
MADLAVSEALPREPKTEEQKLVRDSILLARPGGEVTDDAAAKKVLERFLPRAFRRRLVDGELAEILGLFSTLRSNGDDFDTAIRKTIAASLVSPKFLLRLEETKDTEKAYPVGLYELASRLSYFLWASMPDDELLKLAADGSLAREDVLEGQIRRMLRDRRSNSLGDTFAAQWLGYGILGTRVRMDPIDNPWCTDSLMTAMRQETSMLFVSLVRENQPILRLLDSKHTFLNEELAKHYRIRGIEGSEMRRVKLEDPRRFGLFGHGSVLAITSFPGRTSPVIRGRWILADVLGTPPPPPPPNVSELADEIRENRKLSQRQKLELHRRNPQCASCHDEMDPLGLSLENFDWFGPDAKAKKNQWQTSG